MSALKLSKKDFDERYESTKTLKFEAKSDDWYFEELTFIAFYSGFKADTVNKKVGLIKEYFPDYKTVSKFDQNDINKMMADSKMIKHPGKIEGIIKNAKLFPSIISEFGSIHNYLVSLLPDDTDETLKKFYKTVRSKFAYLGDITTYHFMTEIGLNVVKPDRVLIRIFERLGLITHDKQYWELIVHAREFAKATKQKIRYIDMIFVEYCQVKEYGICLEVKPKCDKCELSKTDYCNYKN